MTDSAPTDEDELKKDPKSSRVWLAHIEEAERVARDWQTKADNIDKLYANLTELSSVTRDRQFQMFWANIQVLGPSIYSRPPIPVVTPRFKDRKPVPRIASELLERCTVVGFDLEDVDALMRQVRDDLTIVARGCAWVRFETKDGQRVCLEHADRKDFLHSPARSWKEVDWVAKASYLSKDGMKDRFKKTSKDAYLKAAYEQRKNDDGADDSLKAKVWELWCKSKNKVVWVTEGVDVVLDDGEPHLTLDGFFPCPRPAFGTVQRRSLIPVPDMLFYKDQLEEINELTARIGALSDALQVRGFYPAGAGEIGDAIESAIKSTTDNQVLIPISNWAMVGSGGVKDMIVWLPIEMVSKTIGELVELRKQLIADVYEITGLSDIMRGSTEASETLGAQQLKSQYGSIRIRDRTNELVRFACDLVKISAEIMAENFTSKTMLDMSQMDIETDADVSKKSTAIEAQIKGIIAKVEQAKSNPQVVQQAKANPQQAQQVLEQAQQQANGLKGQLEQLKEIPTIEKVMKLLKDQRLRPFVLDIETDSTIAPDENAQKQRATEFITAVGGYMGQALPMVEQMPQTSKLFAETLKYVTSQFRAGRQLEGVIDEFADDMAKMASQPQKPNPEAIKAQGEAQQAQAQQQIDAKAAQDKALTERTREMNIHQANMVKEQAAADQRDLEWRKAQLVALTSIEVARIGAKNDTDSQQMSGELEAMLGLAQMQHEKEQTAADQEHELAMQAQDQAHQQGMAESDQEHQADMAANEQQAEPADMEPA